MLGKPLRASTDLSAALLQLVWAKLLGNVSTAA